MTAAPLVGPRSGRRPLKAGFTLIEIMIVLAILGILAAVALQQYTKMQLRGKHAAVQASLRDMSLAQENYYHGTTPPTYTQDMTKLLSAGFVPTPNVSVLVLSSDGQSWQALARYIGTQEVYMYDSAQGGLQPDPLVVP